MTKPKSSGYKKVYCKVCGQYLIDTDSKVKTTEQFYDESTFETCTWLEVHIGRHHQMPVYASWPTFMYLSFEKPVIEREENWANPP